MTRDQSQTTEHWIYVIGDGDNIRQRLEEKLLFDDIEGSRKVSEAITLGMNHIHNLLMSKKGWNVVFCGGDDILIKIDVQEYDAEFLRSVITAFERCSASTMSFGSGYSLQQAYLNLRRAKAIGSGKLMCDTETK